MNNESSSFSDEGGTVKNRKLRQPPQLNTEKNADSPGATYDVEVLRDLARMSRERPKEYAALIKGKAAVVPNFDREVAEFKARGRDISVDAFSSVVTPMLNHRDRKRLQIKRPELTNALSQLVKNDRQRFNDVMTKNSNASEALTDVDSANNYCDLVDLLSEFLVSDRDHHKSKTEQEKAKRIRDRKIAGALSLVITGITVIATMYLQKTCEK